MSWDFETDEEYQAELDWVDAFVTNEVEPVDMVIDHAWDMQDPVRQALIPPLQQQVRDRGSVGHATSARTSAAPATAR